VYIQLILFGGRGNGTLSDTWLFDLTVSDWREVITDVSPEARFGMGSAYDAARNRVLIFAGQDDGFYNDVWAFDVESETWSKLETTGGAPVARYGTSAVVDPQADSLIVSHGFASGRFDDTFALDLKTNTWQEISPDVRPLKRCLHEAVFDVVSGQMILFGGCSSGFGPCPQGDTWSFDPIQQTWMELTASDTRPSPRSNPSLVADPEGVLWLFGGNTDGGRSNDLWSLDPTSASWTLYSAENTPSARSSHDAVWDSVNSRLIAFGGRDSSGALNDLWVYTP
jgi:N-acetylneuraminic acid mutarotase